MAYVFGISGVPIFEMIFIISLLLLIGLVFVLLELRRLGSLISKETLDLSRFEKDLAEFESEGAEDNRINKDLIAYVKGALKKGLSREQIQNSLFQRGWSNEQVDYIFNELDS